MSELPLDPEGCPGTQDYEDWRDQRRRRNRARTHEDYDQFEDYPDDSIWCSDHSPCRYRYDWSLLYGYCRNLRLQA